MSQTEVSTAIGANRVYFSDFENGVANRLTQNQLRKLRALFEAKIEEARANGDEIIGLTFGEPETKQSSPSTALTAPTDPEGIHRAVLAIRHLAIDPSLSNAQISGILEKIAANDRQADELLQQKVKRGFNTDWTDETDHMLKEVFGLFAANHVLLMHLQGRQLAMLQSPVAYDNVKTIGDLFAHLFHD